jgi:methyl-accepting chemotaxis protein
MKSLLARFPIAFKLFAASAIFAIPIGVLLTFVIWQFTSEISTARREIEGAQRLEQLRLASDGLDRHARLSYRKLTGDLSGETQREQAAQQVDKALEAAAPELTARWRQLRSSPPSGPAENAAAHEQLSTAVSKVAQEVGDSSGLILDSDLDSFYLVDLAVVLLPQGQESIASSLRIARKSGSAERPSPADDMRMIADANALEHTSIPGVRRAAETSLREDANFHGISPSLHRNLPPLLNRYGAEVESYVTAVREHAPLAELDAAGERATQATEQLWAASLTELQTLLEKRISDFNRLRFGAILLCVLAMAIAGAVQTIVAINITRPLGEVVALAADVAAGRLKQARERLDGGVVRGMLDIREARDESCRLVRAIAEMTDSLDTLLRHVSRASSQVAESGTRIGAAVRQLEATVTEQAATANQLNATSNEILANVQELARSMTAVSRVAQEASESANGGVSSLDQIHTTMRSLFAAGEGLSTTLSTVEGKAHNVDEVITTITKIANRTNILSLNAAIEAERAGKSAGGFSVVAMEIRRLADQTAVAALDIEKLIQEMQGAVSQGVAGMDRYSAEMRSSSGAVDALSSGLGRVIDGTRKLGPEFETVNQGMQMQSQGAAQMVQSIGELRNAAQQTRDSLGEFRKVAEQLREAVGAMQKEVGRFSAAGG